MKAYSIPNGNFATGSREVAPLQGSPLSPLIFAAVLMTIGTGSALQSPLYTNFTSSSIQIARDRPRVNVTHSIIKLPEQLAQIQAFLGLSVTDISEIFNVKRPTIYSWLNDEVSPHPQNQRKIKRLYEISNDWFAISRTNLAPLIKERLSIGLSLFDILKSSIDNNTLVKNALIEIKAHLDASITQRGKSISELARERGAVRIPSYYPQNLFKNPDGIS